MSFRKSESTFNKSYAEQTRILRENGRSIRSCFRESKNNINLAFLDAKHHNILDTSMLANQVVVLFRNGRFEVLPVGVNGLAIKDYLGVRFHRIAYWSAFPSIASDLNPIKQPGTSRFKTDNDIYEC